MVKVTPISPITYKPQEYSEGDVTSIPSLNINSTFSAQGGKVESAIFDLNNNLIEYNPNALYSAISAGGGGLDLTDIVEVYPEKDVKALEFDQGSYNIIYNFINNELKSSFNNRFKIKEISSNKQEIRLTAGFLTPEELQQEVENFFPVEISSPSYKDFYLNFGNGNLYLANNLLFDDSNNQTSILVKLYKPLPSFVKVGGDVYPWICTLQRETVAFNVEFEQNPIPVKTTIDLKGPNFSLDINNQTHTSTKPTSYNDLFPSGIDSSSISSPYYQLQSILENKGINVNIDYTNFSNFIHFSSAEERIKNFVYKLGLIENSSDENIIEGIIKNFDGFEHWLFYTSASNSSFPSPYPKTTSTPPYTLASTSSTSAIDWYENITYSASIYDADNQDALINTIPTYIIEDPDSESYLTFTKMIGQHFDVLFTYIQDINNRYNADNRLDFGISKDLVGEAIKSMGINLYSGNFTGANIISSLVGINNGNSFLPPLEDGSGGVISNYITASNLPTPIEDVNKEIYKRIYHNLPLLLKQKGSIAGVRTLINCFGIPKEVLDIKEFDISYRPSTQFLPTVGSSGFISFPTKNIVLPPDGDVNQNFLSPIIRAQQDYVINDTYNRDLHYTEIGYSFQGNLDSTSGFNPMDGFPSYDDFYYGTDSYYSSKFKTEADATGTGGSDLLNWDIPLYIRYISFFDTSLFQMIRDFVPLRNSTATGFIVKPTLKERQRQKPAQISGNNKTYQGLVGTEYYDWGSGEYKYRTIGNYDGRKTSIPPGSHGGSFENLNKYVYSEDGDDFKNQDGLLFEPASDGSTISQVSSETTFTVMGYAQQTTATSNASYSIEYKGQEEFYNGIFPQSGQRSTPYTTREFRTKGTDTGLFTYDNNPFNPYKKPTDQVVTGLSLGAGAYTLLEAIQNNFAGVDVIYNPWFQTLHIKIEAGTNSNGDSLTEDILFNLGSVITFQAGGNSYVFNIGPPSLATYVNGNTVVYQVFPAMGTDEEAFMALGSVNLILPFSPSRPYIQPQRWAYSEFNPIINNTSDPSVGRTNYNGIRKSEIHMDVDYTPSAPDPSIPINVDLIADNKALRAAVQDSYYNSRWWNNSRYLGVRNTSIGFNIPIIQEGGIQNVYSTSSIGSDIAVSSSTSTGGRIWTPKPDLGSDLIPGSLTDVPVGDQEAASASSAANIPDEPAES